MRSRRLTATTEARLQGLGPNLFYNLTMGVDMFSRAMPEIVPLLAPGILAGKKAVVIRRHVYNLLANLRRTLDRNDPHRGPWSFSPPNTLDRSSNICSFFKEKRFK